MTEKGMLVDVLSPKGGGSRGVTKGEGDVMLVGPGVAKVFEVRETRVVLALIPRPKYNDCIAVPVELSIGNLTGKVAFGGRFLFSSDSRFTSLNNRQPIAIHDYRMDKETGSYD